MKKLFYILFILLAISCTENKEVSTPEPTNEVVSTTSKNDASLENVIQHFFEASSKKDEKKMTNLVYPSLFNEKLDKSAAQYSFKLRLDATERFSMINVKKDKEPKLVCTVNEDKFYFQTYTSDVDMKLSDSSTISFEDMVSQILTNHPEALIDKADKSIKFTDNGEMLLVNNSNGTYVLPKIFIDYLNVPGLNVKDLKSQFSN